MCGMLELDKTQARGMSAEYVADCVVQTVCARDREVLIAPLLYRITVYLRNFLPNVYFRVMERRALQQSVTHRKTS